MKWNRPRLPRLANRFPQAFQQAFSNNLQPRKISFGPLSLAALWLLAVSWIGAPPAQGTLLGALSVAPSGANLGSVAVGSKSSQTLQLKNTGLAMVILSGGTISGTGFTMSNLYIPLWMAPGVTFNVTVTFAPTTTGTSSGAITITSNGSNPTLTIPISGTGVAPTRTLFLSSSSLNFGAVVPGSASTMDVAVKNTGNSRVTVSQVSVTGSGFSVTGGLGGATIAPGQSANLAVVFLPLSLGNFSGKITIVSNATNSPSTIAVSGSGSGHIVTLSWVGSSSAGVTGYNVYRSGSSGGAYERINLLPTSTTKYADGSVAAGAAYYYVVTAVTASGAESAYSNQIEAVVP